MDGNPYKSRVFLVGSNAIPFFMVEQGDEKSFADALLNQDLLEDLYDRDIHDAPREFKGSLHFAKWLQKEFNETTVYTSLNAFQVETADELKKVKKKIHKPLHAGKLFLTKYSMSFNQKLLFFKGQLH